MMLLTVTGRKTGRKYTTPVEYMNEDGSLWVLTNRDRTWWRNLMKCGNIELLLNRKTISGSAELVLEQREIEKRLVDYLHHSPMAAKPMGIHVQDKSPNAEDITRVAKDRLFVRIKLSE